MENVGGIYYEIQAKTGDLLKADKEVVKFTEKVEESFNRADSAVSDFSETAKQTSAALKMPEVNKLSAQLAQLSGKIGAASDAANDGAVANTKFSGALSTVAGKLGAGYVTNVGSATSSLIKHAKAALDATSAQVDNARAAQQEATALQGAASALALKAAEEKTLAESAAKTAAAEFTAAEAIFERKTADIASLEALLTRQKESLRQAEANLTVTNSEKAVAAAVKARSAVDATSAKIQKQSNQAVKEVVAAEDKAKAAKEAVTAANQKLTAAIKIEAAALATVAKANDAATIAAERHTLATKAQAVAVSGARSALNLLGGPSGILLLAAAGVYSLYQAMSDNQDIEQFKRDIDEAAKRVEYLTQVQAKAAAAKTKIAIDTDTEKLDEASTKVAELKNRLSSAVRFNAPKKDIEDLNNQLGVAQGEYDDLSESIRRNNVLLDAFGQQAERAGSASSEAATANEIYDNSVKGLTTSNSLLEKAINGSLSAAEEWVATSQLEKALSDAGVSAEEAAVQVAKLHDEFERKRSLTFEQMLKQTEQNVNALKIEMQEGAEAAAVYRAQLQAGEMGMTDQGEIDKLIAATREQVRLQKQLSDSKKGGRSLSNTKAKTDTATQALTRQQAALDRLNTGYADGSLELAKYDAVVALGNKASAEQIAKAEQQAESIWKIQQATKAAAEEERKRTQAGQNFTGLQGQVSPVAAVDNTYAQQMAQLDEYVRLYPQRIAEAEAVRAGIEDQYHQKRMAAMWEEWQQQSEINNMLGAAIDSIQGGATNAITGLINGTQSLQESFANIGTTILNSVVGSLVQMGIEWVKSQLMGQAAAAASLASTMAQATAAASAWAPAAMSASIATYGSAAAVGQAAYAESLLAAKGMALAGGRRYGGTVSAGNAYRINEDGRSEIFQTAGGQQAFIPNQSGKIIPADKAGGGGGVVQHITFEINTTGGIDDATKAWIVKSMKQVALYQINDQANRPNGMIQPRTKR
ncbi:hypothetical protein LD712_13260 [Salmonella enterica]|uniref:hypothetical protein n=1 Tax=Salmonella sp. NW809 TaxID=2948295 RepID=UPI0034E47C40|nr:hypothetical protein [Salmonella enterica]EFV3667240.1 hypothetical protein [Salmonella enterica]MDJ4401733.1 hypothetical protein [Salmonella enterica]MDJ6375889.1 hypothetical protein [Salmonella enterica]